MAEYFPGQILEQDTGDHQFLFEKEERVLPLGVCQSDGQVGGFQVTVQVAGLVKAVHSVQYLQCNVIRRLDSEVSLTSQILSH